MTRGGKREGAGRPPAPAKMKLYTFKCYPEEYEQIKANAGKMSVSAFIRQQCLSKKEEEPNEQTESL